MDINKKQWIDNATYSELLTRWRFEPIGSEWFDGELGEYFKQRFFYLRDSMVGEDLIRVSKAVGWDG